MIHGDADTHKYHAALLRALNLYVQPKCPTVVRAPPPPPPRHTIVSFLFPREHRGFLSFLNLCDVDDNSEDVEDAVEEAEEQSEEPLGLLGAPSLHGELGADWDLSRGAFSSASSMWTMAETEEGRRLKRAPPAGGLGVPGSLRGR